MGRADRRQDAIVTEARELASAGLVDDIDLIEVSRTPAVSSDGPQDRRAVAAFETFSNWADDHDTRIHPAFGTRVCYSWETGRQYTALVVPVVALAVYDDDELVAVYPHGTDPHESVFDGLRAVATRDLPDANPPDQSPVPAE